MAPARCHTVGPSLAPTLGVMYTPVPQAQLLEEWLAWARWVNDPDRDPSTAGNYTGFDEFDWTVRNHPGLGWSAILAALEDERFAPYLGYLAAGPLEDLLCLHGANYIDLVEVQARSNPRFAKLLGGVWQSQMTEDIWNRVQSVWVQQP
jgi:hypothetical protein